MSAHPCFDACMGLAKRWAMEIDERGFDPIEGAVCVEHIRDPHLRDAVTELTADETCLVCGRPAAGDGELFAVELEVLFEPIMAGINFLYAPASSLPWDSENREYFGPVRDEYEVLEAVCDGAFDDEAFDRLLDLMATAISGRGTWTPFGAPAETEHLDYGWESFVETVKHSSRFVYAADDGRDTPGVSMLTFLDQLRVYVDGALELVDTLDAGTMVYRGRLVERRSEVPATASKLGPAPSDRAAANRLSPAGISLLYASEDAQTAVAEIAAHGPKPRALIGGFRSTRALTILDLTKTPKMPSVFDPGSRHAYVMARFLRDFVRAVTAPVIPDGREHVEYVPTQVVTEYLRWVPSTRLDGIALPSAQSKVGAKTYVFFVGPAEVADADAERPSSRPTMFFQPDPEPVFILDKKDVELWDVTRSYAAAPSPPWA